MRIAKLAPLLTLALGLLTANVQAKDSNSIQYTVPVTGDLEPFSHFPMSQVKIQLQGNQWIISYNLPAELLGHEKNFTYNSWAQTNNGEIIFTGDYGVMACINLGQANARCDVKYGHPMEVDLNAAREVWVAKNVSERELQGRMEVLAKFSGEPIGGFFIVP